MIRGIEIMSLRHFIWGLVAAAVFAVTPAVAQDRNDSETRPLVQVELTDALMKRFLAMQSDLVALGKQIEGTEQEETDVLKSKLTELAKKNGFATFEEFDDVASTISLVMEGLDPDTKEYVDPKESIAADIEDAKKDTTLTEAERKEVIADLEEARRTTPDVKYPGNIEMVRKYAEQIEKILQ
jgi:hypothetical protein